MVHRREVLVGAMALGAASTASMAWAAEAASLRTAAREAWLYTLPLNEIASVRFRSALGGGVPGTFLPQRSLATPEARIVTTPNNDTIYASAFVDLAQGPATLTLPAFGARYASVAIMDMWSDNVAVLGTRTTGPDAARFTLVGPNTAATPDAIRSPTNWVWILARILVDGPGDIEAARTVQAGVKIEAAPQRKPTLSAKRDGPWQGYFKAVNALLLETPPPGTDLGILRRMAPLGLGRADFDPARFSPEEGAQIEAGVADALPLVKAGGFGVKAQGGWYVQAPDTGEFFQDYSYRARIALAGLAALPPVEAMYLNAIAPGGGVRFDGEGLWRLHFGKGELPPVNAFWSLTMYEATPEGQFFLTPNPISRYAIGDRTPGLLTGADGSLDLWISRTDPGGARSANWLPAPAKGPFSAFLRAYLPKPDLLNGAYTPPPVVKV